jgi:uncharacterized protein YcaQ
LPILWRGGLVGRLDPKAERKAKRFVVRNLVLEPGCPHPAGLAKHLAAALREFASAELPAILRPFWACSPCQY